MRHPVGLMPFLLATLLPAQQGATTFVADRTHAVYEFAVEDVPALLAQLPKTRSGALLAEPAVADAFALALGRFRDRAARRRAVQAMAERLGCARGSAGAFWDLLDLPTLRRLEGVLGMRGTTNADMASVVQIDVLPKAEGKLAARLEQLAASIGKGVDLEPVADAKLGGMPIHRFRHKLPEGEDAAAFERYRPPDLWLGHVPGGFLVGSGEPEASGSLGPAPGGSAPAGAVLRVQFGRLLQLAQGAPGAVGLALQAIGLATVERFEWRLDFAGEQVRDRLQLHLQGEPQGMLAALLTGKAPLPAQPLPAGAMLQLRLALDLPQLLDAVTASVPTAALPQPLRADLLAGFTGGIAIGVAAPAPGAVLPRLFVTFGIADAAAAQRVIDATLARPALEPKPFVHGEVHGSTIAPGELPPAIQPSFCVHGGALHLCESAASLRALLQAAAGGGEAMAIGDVPGPAGDGELQPGFDLRWDEAAIYKACHEVWLPLWALAPMRKEPGFQALLEREDLPRLAEVQGHLGKGRGVLRRQEHTWTFTMQGLVGGPELFAAAIAWGPILSGWAHRDITAEQEALAVSRKQLELAFRALTAHQQAKGSWPAELGELFANGKLADDALLLPGDAAPDTLTVKNSDGTTRQVQCSYRYFPRGVKVVASGGETTMLLVAITPTGYWRAMLAEDGTLPECWGEEVRQPIDAFGKGGGR